MRLLTIVLGSIFLSARTFAFGCCETIDFDERSTKNPSSGFSCDLDDYQLGGFINIQQIELGRLGAETYLVSHMYLGCLGSFRLGEFLRYGAQFKNDHERKVVHQIFGFGDKYKTVIVFDSEEIQFYFTEDKDG